MVNIIMKQVMFQLITNKLYKAHNDEKPNIGLHQ